MFKGFNQVNVYLPEQGIVKKTILVEKGKVTSLKDENVDGLLNLPSDLIVVPGFIDKHIHGASNEDGMYPNQLAIKTIANVIASEGVSAFLVTTMTQSKEKIEAALKNIKEYIAAKHQTGATAIGIHLEGPFICKKYKGAQVEEYIVPCDVATFKHYQEISGNNIKQVTLAYEENGKDLVHYLKETGVVASIGHSDASSDATLEGIKEGITSATHTYNAMKPLHHREIGTVGAVLLSDEIYSEVIADLVHVSPNALKLLLKCKGKEKIVAITDGIEAKHLSDGIYHLGGQEVIVKNSEARLHDGTLAGSTLKMNIALRNLQEVMGLSFTETIDLATINPAINLNISQKKGSIAIGKDADFTVIDKNYEVYYTVANGNIIYQK